MRPTGRARVSSSDPQAFGCCDRCGIWYNLVDLQWQYEWAGTQLYNKFLLFCATCIDTPQEQLRTIVLPPDPAPLQNARVEAFADDEAGPVSSNIVQNANKGDTTVYLQSVTGFAIDQNVLVQMNNAIFAEVEILSINPVANTISVNIPLPYAASISNLVTVALT